jgi:CHAT domain-containing protein
MRQSPLHRKCGDALTVSATITDPALNLYIGNLKTASGMPVQAWVCDGKTKVEVIVFQMWTDKARYTITMVDPPTPTPTPALTPRFRHPFYWTGFVVVGVK